MVLDTESETEQQSRRRGHRLKRAPVIPGQLAAGLREAGVDRATSLIAASESNMLNVEACLRAKRDGSAQIRTIARLFNHEGDELDIARSARAFRVDQPIAAVGAAAPAFVDAALVDESMRWFESGGHAMAALRWPYGEPVGCRQMQRWHDEGVRLLAVRREGEAVRRPASQVPGLREDETGILAGPEAAVVAVLGELRRRAPSASSPRLRAVS